MAQLQNENRGPYICLLPHTHRGQVQKQGNNLCPPDYIINDSRHPLVNFYWPQFDPDTGRDVTHIQVSHFGRCKAKRWETLECTSNSSIVLIFYVKARVHICLETHTHKVPPAASGRLNHTLIKPWSEFELGHYPLTVINAAALLGGQSGQWGRDTRHTCRCWQYILMTAGGMVSVRCTEEICILLINIEILLLYCIVQYCKKKPMHNERKIQNTPQKM